jgi:integrase
MATRRPHGAGHVYRPPYIAKDGTHRPQKVWWLAYRVRGKLVRESSGSEFKADAERKLRARLAAVDSGRLTNPGAHKVTLGDLGKILEDNYAVNGRDPKRATYKFRPIYSYFGTGDAERGRACLARTVTTDRLVTFQRDRLAEGARPATVNRDLAALRRAFRLALKAGRVESMPFFSMLRENNTRTGFFERDAFEVVRSKLPDWLRPLVTFQYLTGWRTGETVTLQWKQVDFKTGVVRIEPGTTKNREGRVLPFRALPELAEMIDAQRELTTALEKESGQIIPWVFHRGGRPLCSRGKAADRAVYTEWNAACVAAGQPGRILHDFRRTAVRNLERAGVSRSVAMKITGHKTEAVYRRYAIVSEADLAEGLAKVAVLPRK